MTVPESSQLDAQESEPTPPTPRRRPVDWLKAALVNVAVAGVTLAVCLGLLEVVARWARPAPKAGKERGERWLYIEHDPVLGWRKRPGAKVLLDRRDYTVELQINARGLRDPERDYPTPAGTYRVLALGDSFVEGYTVPLEQSVTQRLERWLGSGEGCPVEVINGGTTGYSTDQEYLFYKHEGVRYRPKVAVLLLYYNDLLPNLATDSYHVSKPLLAFDGEQVEIANLPLRPLTPPRPRVRAPEPPPSGSAAFAWLSTRLEGGAPRAYNALARFGLWPPISQSNVPPELRVFRKRMPPDIEAAWLQTARILRALRREAQAHGTPLVLAYIPSRFEVNDNDWDATYLGYGMQLDRWDRTKVASELAGLAQREGLPFIDLGPALRRSAARFGGQPYFSTDSHWNATGQDVAAQALARFLVSLGLAPACAPR